MHIGPNEMNNYGRVAGAVGLTSGVSLQVQEILNQAKPDASGKLEYKDEVSQLSLQLSPEDGQLKEFRSVILQNIKSGEQLIPQGTENSFQVKEDKSQVYHTKVPTEGGVIEAEVVVQPNGEMSFNGEPITQQDQEIFAAVTAAQQLSGLTTQMLNNAAGVLDTPADQNPTEGSLKVADATAQVTMQTTKTNDGYVPTHFRADYFQDIGSNGQVEIPAGSTLEWQVTDGGCQEIESNAPVGDQILRQELTTNADGSYEFNQFLIPKQK